MIEIGIEFVGDSFSDKITGLCKPDPVPDCPATPDAAQQTTFATAFTHPITGTVDFTNCAQHQLGGVTGTDPITAVNSCICRTQPSVKVTPTDPGQTGLRDMCPALTTCCAEEKAVRTRLPPPDTSLWWLWC